MLRGLQGIKRPSELQVYRNVSLTEDLLAEVKLDDGVTSKKPHGVDSPEIERVLHCARARV